MDACAARCSKWVYSWWLNPLLQWDASHLIWACLKMGPPVMAIFWWENYDKAGEIGTNPSKSLNVQIPNPFCVSWMLLMPQTQPLFASASITDLKHRFWRSGMARSSSIVAPLLVLASVALAVPLAAHLGIPGSDEILPRLHLQKEIDPIHPILS